MQWLDARWEYHTPACWSLDGVGFDHEEMPRWRPTASGYLLKRGWQGDKEGDGRLVSDGLPSFWIALGGGPVLSIVGMLWHCPLPIGRGGSVGRAGSLGP